MLYFAYGSNMSSARLIQRVPSAVQKDIGLLHSHRIEFHKVSFKDSSAKCDAFHTGNADNFLAGVLYEISPEQRELLDRVEGLGHGYEVKTVKIKTCSGQDVIAFTYYATKINPTLKPFHWYKHHVLWGAKEHGLPDDYIEQLIAIDSIEDLDASRVEKELSVYINR
jgi:gamma-glutamylcyclotransferase